MAEYERLNKERWGLFPKAALLGLLTGLLAAAFRFGLERGEGLFHAWVAWCRGLGWQGLGLLALQAVGTTAAAVLLVRAFCPEAAGSGIPHLKLVLLGRRPLHGSRVLVVKFLSGLVGISGGLALGREGPTVQMGAALGAVVGGGWSNRTREEREAMLICGAAAGLSAAFNAPLAGVIFALEELQVRFNQSVFFAAAVASLLADTVVRWLLGELPVFRVTIDHAPGILQLPHSLAIGVVAGLLGVLFCRGLLLSVRACRSAPARYSLWAGGLTAAAIAAVAWFEPRAAGGGFPLVDELFAGRQGLWALVVLLLARFALSVSSYSLGSAGGIFAPMLLIGGLLGMALGKAALMLGVPHTPGPAVAALIGMAAFFAAVVRCPLTGIVLLVEMTGFYPLVLVLLAGSFAAVGVADLCHQEPVYEALMSLDARERQDEVPRDRAA